MQKRHFDGQAYSDSQLTATFHTGNYSYRFDNLADKLRNFTFGEVTDTSSVNRFSDISKPTVATVLRTQSTTFIVSGRVCGTSSEFALKISIFLQVSFNQWTILGSVILVFGVSLICLLCWIRHTDRSSKTPSDEQFQMASTRPLLSNNSDYQDWMEAMRIHSGYIKNFFSFL